MDKFNKKCNRFSKGITFFLLIALFLSGFLIFLPNYNTIFATSPNANGKSVSRINNSAIVLEQSSKRILYGENIDVKLPMASTTKILTALVVLNNFEDINIKYKIPKEAVGIEGSSIYLREGEELTIKDLLYGLMLRSGNDSAVALAIATAGNVENFVKLMNETAIKAGAVNSNFVNPHGLHNDMHYTTAYDLGLITCVAMENPYFRDIVSTTATRTSGEEPRYLVNKNKMLKIYDGANGVKTGFTKKAGRCLVSSAVRGDMQLISVVINHGAMWEDSIFMLDNAFSKYKMYTVFNAEDYLTTIKVLGGKYPCVLVEPENSATYPLTADEYNNLKINVNLDNCIIAPVKTGQNVGTLEVYNGNCLLFVSDFTTMHNVDKKGFFTRKM